MKFFISILFLLVKFVGDVLYDYAKAQSAPVIISKIKHFFEEIESRLIKKKLC